MRKRRQTLFLIASFITLAAIVAILTGVLARHFLTTTNTTSSTRCTTEGIAHSVTIAHNQVQPQHTSGKLCDTLTILNTDNMIRLIAFGPHENHVAYDGVTEQVLGPDQHMTITLNQVGTFQFHDHIHDATNGTFSVTR